MAFTVGDLGHGWSIKSERNHLLLTLNGKRVMVDHYSVFDDYKYFTKDFSGKILLGGLVLGYLLLTYKIEKV